MAPRFAHYGVSVGLPELGGAVDPDVAAHDELMVLLDIISKREVVRARVRVDGRPLVRTTSLWAEHSIHEVRKHAIPRASPVGRISARRDQRRGIIVILVVTARASASIVWNPGFFRYTDL
ncbi:hypothetical protein GCM10023205_73970 [Yinghuangia aomiensis]|uniref:Uncharacterized protein n=2 Tax=Yinghuangia aomiensis TaxID=676205 RepID=A0ABP9I7Z9_9ACTN